MSEYTLPVSRLRADYIAMREQHYGFVDLYAEEWDRAMAAHDAEVAEKAWDEGYSTGRRDQAEHSMYREVYTSNPYSARADQIEKEADR